MQSKAWCAENLANVDETLQWNHHLYDAATYGSSRTQHALQYAHVFLACVNETTGSVDSAVEVHAILWNPYPHLAKFAPNAVSSRRDHR